ncbi:LADA_0H18074g1_1 [Lachancea dasiensis]|uniref:peptidylprolyl isomerase n=1 Tax=Lachancea dasiensis TaxID=1072105 RepID=A0A1G4K5R9_9SACH|nr:LADA_0H18074g1_1 [Lachancea dasiensis]
MGGKCAYLDIRIGSEPIGRIVLELFWDKAPLACENFLKLSSDGVKVGDQHFEFRNNSFHRLIQNFMIQAGDVIYGRADQIAENSTQVGKGGCSIYAEESEIEHTTASDSIHCYGNFKDENTVEFTHPFMLAMANMGTENSNSSQFFITTSAAQHLNHKHSIFGYVLHGKSVVRTVEHLNVDSDGLPLEPVVIENCGEWIESMGVPVFNTCNDKLGGDIYEEFPDDDDHFDKESAEKALEAATTIKNSGSLLFKQRDLQNAFFKYKKALRYVNECIPETDVSKEFNLKFNDLKAKLYLNMSLVKFQQEQFEDAQTFATYLLEMPNPSGVDKAKALYRRGNCHYVKRRFEDALKDYKACKELKPNDEAVDQKITNTMNSLEEAKEKTRKNIAKFFS